MRKIALVLVLVFAGLSLSAQNQAQTLRTLQEQQERGFKYFYIEGLRSKLWGRTEEAFKNFQQCLQFKQDDALIYYELANLYFTVGQNQEGYQMLKKAAELRPENRWYLLYMANLYLQSNQKLQAAQAFEKLLEKEPSNKIYLYRLAQLHTDLKDYENAISDYERLENLVGKSEMISMEKRRLYSLSGKQEITISMLKNEIKAHPDNVMNYVLLGDTYLEIKDAKNALKYYEKAKKVDPSFGGIYLSLANYYQAIGQTDEMIGSLRSALKSESLEMDTKKQVYLQYILKSESDSVLNAQVNEFYEILDSLSGDDPELKFYYGNYLIGKQDTTGYKYLKESLEINPLQKDVWLQILGFYLQKNDEDNVLNICNQALEYFPTVAELHFYKSLVMSMRGEYEESIAILKTGLPYSANRKDLLVRMLTTIGDMYYQIEQLDSTFAYYDKVLLIDENNILVLNNYAYFLAITDGDLTLAENMSAKTVQLEPGNSTYLDTYAWILFLKGDKFLSKFYIEKAISNLSTTNGEILEHYGHILLLNDDIIGAKEQWQKAIDIEWNVEEIQKLIDNLQ